MQDHGVGIAVELLETQPAVVFPLNLLNRVLQHAPDRIDVPFVHVILLERLAEIRHLKSTESMSSSNIHWLIDWLRSWFIQGLIRRLIDWLINRKVALLDDWPVDWLVDWLIDELHYWITERSIDWLIDWLGPPEMPEFASYSGHEPVVVRPLRWLMAVPMWMLTA